MLVIRVKVFEDETGTCVRNRSAELSTFIPSEAVAVEDGNVPSGLKFRNDENTSVDGAREEL